MRKSARILPLFGDAQPAGRTKSARINVSDLSLGTAAEHLVCADLLLQGYRAFLSDQNCPYDVVVDIGARLVRIQVKATAEPRRTPQRVGDFLTYQWYVRRAGKGGRRVYAMGEFDLLALVATDARRVAYLPPEEQRQTVHIRPHDDPRDLGSGAKFGKTFGQYPFARALGHVLGLPDEMAINSPSLFADEAS